MICSCGRELRIIDACSVDGCRLFYICTGCNREYNECVCSQRA